MLGITSLQFEDLCDLNPKDVDSMLIPLKERGFLLYGIYDRI